MRKFALIILIFIILLPLSATSLRVGFYNLPNDISEDFMSAFSNIIASNVRSQFLDNLCKERFKNSFEKQEDLRIHKELGKENINVERKTFTYEPFSSVDKVAATVPSSLHDSVFAQDKVVLDYILNYNDLDLLVCYSSEIDGALSFINVFCYDGDIKPLIDTVYLTNERPSFYDGILLSIASLYYPDVAFISEEGTLTAVDVSLKEYKGQDIELESGKVFEFLKEEKPLENHTQLIFSIPYDASLSIFAIEKTSLPLCVTSNESDIILSLNKEGFSGSTFQLDNSRDSINALYLKPTWVKDSGRLKSEKDEFYRCLRNTFLSFSLYAISKSVNNINSDIGAFGKVMEVATAGISIVNLIELIKSCTNYYNRAKETYL